MTEAIEHYLLIEHKLQILQLLQTQFERLQIICSFDVIEILPQFDNITLEI